MQFFVWFISKINTQSCLYMHFLWDYEEALLDNDVTVIIKICSYYLLNEVSMIS